MHHEAVSTNYDYLPHNILPSLYPTPQAYRDTPIQPLGDRLAVYEEFLQGCVDYYYYYSDGDDSRKCGDYERDRVAMNLRQPQSMINYTNTVRAGLASGRPIHSFFHCWRGVQSLTHFHLFVFLYSSRDFKR
jgi:hypothetical protein